MNIWKLFSNITSSSSSKKEDDFIADKKELVYEITKQDNLSSAYAEAEKLLKNKKIINPELEEDKTILIKWEENDLQKAISSGQDFVKEEIWKNKTDVDHIIKDTQSWFKDKVLEDKINQNKIEKIWDFLTKNSCINQNQCNEILDIQKKLKKDGIYKPFWQIALELWYVKSEENLIELLRRNNIKIPLWTLLLNEKRITEEELKMALREQEDTKKTLWEILIRKKIITEDDIVSTYAKQYKLTKINPNQWDLDMELFFLFKKHELALMEDEFDFRWQEYKFIPYKLEYFPNTGFVVKVVIYEYDNKVIKEIIDSIKFKLKRNPELNNNKINNFYSKILIVKEDKDDIKLKNNGKYNFDESEENIGNFDKMKLNKDIKIKFLLCSKTEIKNFIETLYRDKNKIEELRKNTKEFEQLRKDKVFTIWRWLEYKIYHIDILANIIVNALEKNASDIHIEPTDTTLKVRFRVDGVLYDQEDYPMEMTDAFFKAVKNKLEFRLDMLNTDWWWDERIKVNYINQDKETEVNLRVSIVPTQYWQNMTIRILHQDTDILSLNQLWIASKMLENLIKNILSKKAWMVIVTWPTWSGKTTTLHSFLNYLNNDEKKIITIEDPIEYLVPWATQIKVIWEDVIENTWKKKNDLQYKEALKLILRQDPDIIMVWEIRDSESASKAVEISETWRLLFTTLHTISAVNSILRLNNLWISNTSLSSSLIAIIAQRLVRKICVYCKKSHSPNNELLDSIKSSVDIDSLKEHLDKFKKWTWCNYCNWTWYKWRLAVYEVLFFNKNVRKAISEWKTIEDILDIARKGNMTFMIEDWILKALAWLTTLEEIVRVCENIDDDIVYEVGKIKKILWWYNVK